MPEKSTEKKQKQNHFADDFIKDKRGGSKKWIFITSGVIVAIILVIFFSRASAEITVYPKEATVTSNASAAVPFTAVDISVEKNVPVKATGEEKVSQKSKGKITIYNEYEEEDQRLLKETRFESSGGLIYRIPVSVIVPGLKRDDKGNVIPGKLEVEVVADQVGEKYNIGSGKFTVPGFKELPQYKSFYAVSTGSMSGGFDGIRKVISESDRQSAENTLKTQIKDQLITDAKAKSTEGTVVIADDSMIVYEILADKVEGDNVFVSAKGTIKAISFDSVVLGNNLAFASIPSFSTNENVKINNIDEVNITLNPNESDATKINVEVSGTIDFLWQNNYEAFKTAVAGTNKDDIKTVLDQFPGITRAESVISPVWSSVFPEDVGKISVIDGEN